MIIRKSITLFITITCIGQAYALASITEKGSSSITYSQLSTYINSDLNAGGFSTVPRKAARTLDITPELYKIEQKYRDKTIEFKERERQIAEILAKSLIELSETPENKSPLVIARNGTYNNVDTVYIDYGGTLCTTSDGYIDAAELRKIGDTFARMEKLGIKNINILSVEPPYSLAKTLKDIPHFHMLKSIIQAAMETLQE